MSIFQKWALIGISASILLACLIAFNVSNGPETVDRSVRVVGAPYTDIIGGSAFKSAQSSYTPVLGWTVRSPAPAAAAEKPNPLHAKLFFDKLQATVHNTQQDPAWSSQAEDKLQRMVSNLPNIKGKPQVHCGAKLCEIIVQTNANIDAHAKEFVLQRLAEPAFNNDPSRTFIVRQIFSNKDVNAPEEGFYAYYMKRAA